MSSAEGVNSQSKLPPDQRLNIARPGELKTYPKSTEEFVAIENRLAAQREQPKPTPELKSIFDQLRGRLPS